MKATKISESASVTSVHQRRQLSPKRESKNSDASVSATRLHRPRRQENGAGHEEDFQLVLPLDAAADMSGNHAAGQNGARNDKGDGAEIERKIDKALKRARQARPVERCG